jgi:putative ABC transport system permease protein
VLFTSAVAVATGLGFGAAPALSVSRTSLQGTLRDEARASSEGARSRRLRGLLVAGQLALCVSLLAGAGLLVRSLRAMSALPLGFDPGGVLVVAVQLPRAGYTTPAPRVQFMDRLAERLRALPGVVAVASAGQAPSRVTNRNGFVVPGMAAPPADAQSIMLFTEVSDDYFRTLGIPLVEGRTFGREDGGEGPPAIVISQRAARAYWPRGGAVGARVRMGQREDAPEMVIVGVVGDVRNDPAQAEPEPVQYMSYRANPWNGPVFFLRVRGGTDPLALAPAVRRALAAVDPGAPLQQVTTLRALLAERLSGRRLPVLLMSAFGSLALLLASVGVYAMFAAMAAARAREFGVRVALGSTPRAIAALVLRQGGAWLALGLAGGAAGVAAVARLVRGLLYGVGPFDPVALGAAVAVLLACAAAALLVPVRRATRADPIAALRE